MKSVIAILLAITLGACASYSGRGLETGKSTLGDVLHTMGQPAMRWHDPDGSVQLAYPRGPGGFHTFMAHIGPNGKLLHIENVLNEKSFDRIWGGMTKDQVLRMLGPPQPAWTAYFERRDELAWEWRYCDIWHAASRFDVLFDATRGIVRSTTNWREDCGTGDCPC